jgi:hypothetical protein
VEVIMRLTWTVVVVVVGLVLLLAQPSSGWEPSVPAQMEQLGFLVGLWEGAGWVWAGPDERSSCDVTMDVEALLGGAVLVVQLRTASDTEGACRSLVQGEALRVINYDQWSKSYRVRSFMANGQNTDWEVEVDGGVLTCWYDDVRAGRTRFTLEQTPKGDLREFGDAKNAISPPDEEHWMPHHEFVLKRRVAP